MKITSHPSDEIANSLGSKGSIHYDNSYTDPATYAIPSGGAPVAYPAHLSSSFHPTSNNSYPFSSATSQTQPYSILTAQQSFMAPSSASFLHMGYNTLAANAATTINANAMIKPQTGLHSDSSSVTIPSSTISMVSGSSNPPNDHSTSIVMHSISSNGADSMSSSSSTSSSSSSTSLSSQMNNAQLADAKNSIRSATPGQAINHLRNKLIHVDFKKLKAPSIDKYLWYFEIERDMNNDLVSVASSHFENQINNIISKSTSGDNYANSNSISSNNNNNTKPHHQSGYDSDKDAELEGQILPRFFETLEVFDTRKKQAKLRDQRSSKNYGHISSNPLAQIDDGSNANNESFDDQNEKELLNGHGSSAHQRIQTSIDKKANAITQRGLSRSNDSDAYDNGIVGRKANGQNANINGFSSSNGNSRGMHAPSSRDGLNDTIPAKRPYTKRKREVDLSSSASTSSAANNAASLNETKMELIQVPEIIPNGRHTAAFIDGTWVYSRVLKFNKKTKYYMVEDADEPAKGRPPTYEVPKNHVLMLFTEQECLSMPPYPSGSRVLAMFPQTTSFYPATISGVTTRRPKSRTGSSFPANSAVNIEYLLQFDGDDKDDSNKTKVRRVPRNLVVSCAGVDDRLLKLQD